MSHVTKGLVATSEFEVDPQDLLHHSHLRTIHLVDGARVSLTMLVLLSGITILGTSGHALDVYNNTSLATNFLLPLWPDEFDARPTVALVIGSAIIILASILSLAFSKTPSLRNRAAIHIPLTFVAPFIGFTASMIAMIFFYAVNTSSTVDTLQSWSCQWESIEMTAQPHFGTLCRESKTALYMSVVIVPVEAVILSLAGYQLTLEKKAADFAHSTKRGSPTPSA